MSIRTQPSTPRPARSTAATRGMQVAVIVCGLAGGLVEFFALQRRRLRRDRRLAMIPWWY
ncbi:hypothetical protein [Hydrogenophaga sp. MI9]|uniref:hypothetical protein n=1 Tax=Hydrogenophaga sp. MI9 TaxID=3453719 RepID=UPI003EEE1C81